MNDSTKTINIPFDLHPDVAHGTKEFPFQVHESYCPDGLSLYPHIHEEFEFLYILEGQGIVYVDGKEYLLSKGQSIFINSNCVHLAKKADNNSAAFFSIVFSPLFLGNLINDVITDKYVTPIINQQLVFPILFNNSSLWQNEVNSISLKLYNISKSSSPSELEIKYLLFSLWCVLCTHARYLNNVKPSKSLEQVRSSIDFISEHYQEKITLQDISDYVHLSTGHFSRLFTKIIKCSPIDYLIHFRLQQSCNLLKKSDLPIGTIALDCGFNDFSYYSKKFREEMGCSPKEYRQL